MAENPYQSPRADSGSTATSTKDRSELVKELEKIRKARKYMLVGLPLVGMSTLLQYAGIFRAGMLPNWFGLVCIALLAIQIPVISWKISKLESEIAETQ
ncbi:MAG: hypothetical protein AAFU85_08445 [Planctomycetota bacterium]